MDFQPDVFEIGVVNYAHKAKAMAGSKIFFLSFFFF